MKPTLFRIEQQFTCEDYRDVTTLALVIANTADQIVDYMLREHVSTWLDCYCEKDENELAVVRQDYIKNCGDFHIEYPVEPYARQFRWVKVSAVSEDQIKMLFELGLIADLRN